MFITDAYAQTAASAAGAGGGDMSAMLIQLAPFVLMFAVFYFLIIRPQQQQRKKLQESISALKKGDVIVTSGGLIGKIKSVADDELRVELSPNVEVRLMRYAVGEVRSKTEPAPANDTKSASAS
jgi:preprotein translocase subunit YajC